MNVYNNCPLDARDFTDYRSSSDINNQIKQENKINNSFEFNKFLNTKGLEMQQKKANEIKQLYKCTNENIDNDYSVSDNDLNTQNYKTY